MSYDFAKKRVLVTGAAQGIGRGIVERLIESNATVIAVDVNAENLGNLKITFPNIETLTVNICNWAETEAVVNSAFPIDFLVNNAGIGIIGPLTEITQEELDSIFSVNVKGLINMTKIVVKQLEERKCAGAIVNISSQASQAALLNHSLYCASKGAVDAFTRAVALEFGPKNIRINCVNPTVVLTQLGRKIWANAEMGGPMLAKIPLGRFAEIDDVVDAVVFLLSDRAKMITGSCLAVDGGYLAT